MINGYNTDNIRRYFKYLIKDYYRKKINDLDIEKQLKSIGIDGNIYKVILVLKANIKPRVLKRISRAALRKNALVNLFDFYAHRRSGDYHKIKFYREVCVDREIVLIERRIWKEYLDGGIVPLSYSQYTAPELPFYEEDK